MYRTTTLCTLFAAAGLSLAAYPQSVRTLLDRPGSQADSTEHTFWWLDLNGDQLQDALGIAPDGRLHLSMARSDGTFSDATDEVGLAGVAHARFGIWQDYDGDGRGDLFVGTSTGKSYLLQGQRDGTFVDMAAAAGVVHAGCDVAACFVDVDHDGRIDLHVRTLEGEHLYRNLGSGLFESVDLARATPQPTLARAGSVIPRDASEDAPGADDEGTTPGSRPVDRSERNSMDRSGRELAEARPLERGTSTEPAREEGLSLSCSDSIRDQSTGNCIQAFSVPTLGTMCPLSTDFNLDANGRVGMGTTSPADRLHVENGDLRVSGTAGREILLLDGDGATGVRLDTTASGTANDIELYRDGVLAMDHLAGPSGYVQRFFNVASGTETLSGGTSASDASGVLLLREAATGAVTARLDADADDVANGSQSGILELRSSGTGASGGRIVLANNDGTTSLRATGGVSGAGALLEMWNGAGSRLVEVDTNPAGFGAELNLYNDLAKKTVSIDSDSNDGALVQLYDGVTSQATIFLDADGSGTAGGGEFRIGGSNGTSRVVLDGDSDNNGGSIAVRHDGGVPTFTVTGDAGSNSSELSMFNDQEHVTTLLVEARDAAATGGRLLMFATNGTRTVELDGEDSGDGQLVLSENDGSKAFEMFNNDFTMFNSAGAATVNYDRQTGTKSGVLTTADYGQRLLYCVESTEVWFEDFGTAQLEGGRVRIDLDPVFLQTVTIDEAHPLKVFITLNGETRGVYVEKARDSFTVVEQQGGASDAGFDWRAVAKRKGTEELRLTPFPRVQAEGGDAADPATAPAGR